MKAFFCHIFRINAYSYILYRKKLILSIKKRHVWGVAEAYLVNNYGLTCFALMNLGVLTETFSQKKKQTPSASFFADLLCKICDCDGSGACVSTDNASDVCVPDGGIEREQYCGLVVLEFAESFIACAGISEQKRH